MTSTEEVEIRGLLARAFHFTYGDGADPRVGAALATEAVGRGLLALIPLVREIGDQLDMIGRNTRSAHDVIETAVDEAIEAHRENSPHIYADGSTS